MVKKKKSNRFQVHRRPRRRRGAWAVPQGERRASGFWCAHVPRRCGSLRGRPLRVRASAWAASARAGLCALRLPPTGPLGTSARLRASASHSTAMGHARSRGRPPLQQVAIHLPVAHLLAAPFAVPRPVDRALDRHCLSFLFGVARGKKLRRKSDAIHSADRTRDHTG